MWSKQKLKKEILKYVDQVGLPEFLYEEIVKILDNVNYYKLKNLYNNLDTFIDYLDSLKQSYYQEIKDFIINEK